MHLFKKLLVVLSTVMITISMASHAEAARKARVGESWTTPAGYSVNLKYLHVIVNNGNKSNSWPYTQFYSPKHHGQILTMGHKMRNDINSLSIPAKTRVELFNSTNGTKRVFVAYNNTSKPKVYHLGRGAKNEADAIRVTYQANNTNVCPTPKYLDWKGSAWTCDYRLGKIGSKQHVIFNNGHYDNQQMGNAFTSLSKFKKEVKKVQGLFLILPKNQFKDVNRVYVPPMTRVVLAHTRDGKSYVEIFENRSNGKRHFAIGANKNRATHYRVEGVNEEMLGHPGRTSHGYIVTKYVLN